MTKAKQITPEIQMKAEEYINLGYQRLLTFEVNSGGFSLFGDPPPSVWLSAYGLMEMSDMSKVYAIDTDIITRTRDYILKNQKSDGSWEDKQVDNLKLTAFVVWALAISDYKGIEIDEGVNYLKNSINDKSDPYLLGLVANALLSVDSKDSTALYIAEKLNKNAIVENEWLYWNTTERTLSFSGGHSEIETTAIILQAFIKAGKYPKTVEKGLNFILQKKDSYGNWNHTQATVLCLKTLIEATSQISSIEGTEYVNVKINGKEAEKLEFTSENFDVLRQLDLKEYTVEGDNQIEIIPSENINPLYQIIPIYYLPWKDIRPDPENPLKINLNYDRTNLKVNDTLKVSVKIKNSGGSIPGMVLATLGIPPGFSVMEDDFKALRENGLIDRYEFTGRQVILYFENMEYNKTVEFDYRLKAKFPLRVTSPFSKVYEYYNPEVESYFRPGQIKVD